MIVGAVLVGLPRAVPLEPDADEGRRLLADELAKPVYQEARPTLFDLISKAIGDWLASLTSGASGPGGPIGLVVILTLIAALVAVAFLVFGRPRLERRRRSSSALFGDQDVRTAEQMRAAARQAAEDEEWDTAVLEMFRALARSLDERTLVDLSPGTTASGFARQAARPFPDQQAPLTDAARTFDAVRYLGGHASREEFDAASALDAALTAATPSLPAVPAPGALVR